MYVLRTHNSMDKSHRHYVEWNKPETEKTNSWSSEEWLPPNVVVIMLTERGYDRTFWSDGNILYLDPGGGGYTGV